MRVYSCLDYEPKKKRRRIEYEANGIAKHSTGICVIVTFGHFLVIEWNSVIYPQPCPPLLSFDSRRFPIFEKQSRSNTNRVHVSEYNTYIHEYYLRSNILITRVNTKNAHVYFHFHSFHGTCALADARVLLFRSICLFRETSKSSD